MERILPLILALVLTGCSWSFTKPSEPYAVPIQKEVLEVCEKPINLSTDIDWAAVLDQKIMEASLYRACSDKHTALRKLLQRLNDEQIIRLTTSGS